MAARGDLQVCAGEVERCTGELKLDDDAGNNLIATNLEIRLDKELGITLYTSQMVVGKPD